jgi:GH15 family glucan-1,4-alpha-glucosidase
VRGLADRATAPIDCPSSGVWELREPMWLVSAEIGRWLALERALTIAARHRPWHRRRRWRRARDQARTAVLAAIAPDGRLPPYPGATDSDATALWLVTYGLLSGKDPRARRLVETVLDDLGAGPLVYRYPPDGRDGFSPGEAPFVPASWWLIAALVRVGRVDEAQTRADALCAMLPSLLSEEHDPVTGRALGNVPLVWSHAEAARALHELHRATGRLARLRRRLRR